MILSSRPVSAHGFSLVEVTLALGVAAFCLIAVFGLLPVGVNNNQASVAQTAAASAAASVVADLRSTPRATTAAPAPVSPLFALPIPASGSATKHTVFLHEDGSLASANGTGMDSPADPAQNPAFRVTVYCYPPASTSQRTATTARVLVTWPALADRTVTTNVAGTDPSRFAGSVEIVAALDRN